MNALWILVGLVVAVLALALGRRKTWKAISRAKVEAARAEHVADELDDQIEELEQLEAAQASLDAAADEALVEDVSEALEGELPVEPDAAPAPSSAALRRLR